MEKAKKVRKITTIFLVVILLGLVGGISYAVYNYTFTGNQNTIETDDIRLEFLESNSEIISMVNAIPETDDEGLTEDPFEFVVTSKTKRDMSIGYTLSIEKLAVDSGYTSLNDSDIKVYLTDFNDTVLVEPTLISNLSNYKLYNKTHTHNSSAEEIKDKYKLRAWINYDVNASSWDETTKLQYKFKIGVNGREMTPPESFATDSWDTIVSAAKSGNTSAYNVGDTKEIDMGTYGTHTLRIANKSAPSECNTTGFSQTACGFVLEFADIITKHNMNPSGTYKGVNYDYGWNVDGWPSSSMRDFISTDIYNALPSELKSAIIDTIVVSGHGSRLGETNFTSTDKLYLLSAREVWEDGSSNQVSSCDTAWNNSRQLDYYAGLGVTTSNYSGAIKKNGSTASYWWLRSAYFDYDSNFLDVTSDGDWIYYDAVDSDNGVSPAFRLG